MPEPIALTLSRLRLDVQNPRLLGSATDQTEILRMMARRQGVKIVNLAADITDRGLNPSSLFIVLPSREDEYIVLDGNRRLSAIRLLENPAQADGIFSTSQSSRLQDLSAIYAASPLQEAGCVVFHTRTEADHWIALTHTGEMEGVGSVLWGSDEAARHRALTTEEPSNPGTQILNLLEKQGVIDQEERVKIPVTNLNRLMGTEEFRKAVGLELERKVVKAKGAPASVIRVLAYVAELFKEKAKTERDIHTWPQRVEFARSLPPELIVEQTLDDGDLVAVEEIPVLSPEELALTPTVTQEKGQASGTGRSNTERNSLPRPRNTLIPGSCSIDVSIPRTKDIEIELRRLSLSQTPNAVGVLLRVFLEMSLDEYITREKLNVRERDPLSRKLRATKEDLLNKGSINQHQADAVERAAAGNNFLHPSVTLLHAYIHNPSMSPTASELRAHWDSIQSFMEAVWPTTP